MGRLRFCLGEAEVVVVSMAVARDTAATAAAVAAGVEAQLLHWLWHAR